MSPILLPKRLAQLLCIRNSFYMVRASWVTTYSTSSEEDVSLASDERFAIVSSVVVLCMCDVLFDKLLLSRCRAHVWWVAFQALCCKHFRYLSTLNWFFCSAMLWSQEMILMSLDTFTFNFLLHQNFYLTIGEECSVKIFTLGVILR